MASGSLTIDDLPNEILIHLLSPFPTLQLLPLTQISRRFHALTLRILHNRLASAAALPEHQLILECYHPSAKISTPYLHCDYLGTDGLEQGEGNLGLGQLKALYSRFRPVVQEENRRPRRRYPTRPQGDGQDQDGALAGSAQVLNEDVEAPAHDIYLDESELFSQLCTVTNLVKVGPKRGLFLSHVNVSDGVVRVWRNWLSTAAARCVSGAGSGPADGEHILWADAAKNVGLRFRVREKAEGVRPVLALSNEDLPVNYTLEYEELFVRTTQLLLNVERSDAQEVTNTDLGYVLEGGNKMPCMGQLFYWANPAPMFYQQRSWAAAPVGA